ncbi:MAG: hypothetical protein FWD51_03520 [Betaproteobacteria bacterium]|nr:hypothetical protein [Betaproteobacteria bacterium]
MVISRKERDEYLRDFVAWIKVRRPIGKSLGYTHDPKSKDKVFHDPKPKDEVLEYIANEIDVMLKKEEEGKPHTPFRRVSRKKLDWEIFFHCNWPKEFGYPVGRHTASGGLYSAVGKVFHKSPQAVQSEHDKCLKEYGTHEGMQSFLSWFAKYKKVNFVMIQKQDCMKKDT